MAKDNISGTQIWIVTPFEQPDVGLAAAVAISGAFPILHLGQNKSKAEAALNELAALTETFGVCMSYGTKWHVAFPGAVSKLILPWGMKKPHGVKVEIVWQIHSWQNAEEALKSGAKTLILKGNEGAGLCGDDSTFILFQKLNSLCLKAGAAMYIQGGAGIHSTAAYIALGAAGVVLDSQTALFPECGLSQEHKKALARLTGNEIRRYSGYNCYVFPGTAEPGGLAELDNLLAWINDAGAKVLPLGQDIILSSDLADQYKSIKLLVCALKRTVSSHVKQARNSNIFSQSGHTANILGTKYPIVQGPMARISDTPGFLRCVADGGALPILAMSMMKGNAAADALRAMAAAMDGQPWGAGILGFAYPKTLAEQTKLLLETKPSFVLIAGGHPAQARVFEREGIRVLMHAPTPGLLDLLIKEGVRIFIFEGRESGGHVGPLYSTVLWDKQINRLLAADKPSECSAFFAGGIHDALSAAFVNIMTAPLAMRDVNIGLQCGTAYLYTEEAVAYKAISNIYQHILLEKEQTLLLKSGAGQETRCVPSPYSDFFCAEKAKMQKEALETGEILMRLEAMNLGRLRIAAKGIERVNTELVSLSEKEQLEKGLFMTGAVTSLREEITTIPNLHEELITGSVNLISDLTMPNLAESSAVSAEVAIIGMAGIFPGAADIDEYWRNILFARDCITEVPRERWNAGLFYDPDAKDTDHVASKWGGFIGKTAFNALEFGITPQSLAAIEPVQILSLLVAKRALEDAGFMDLSLVDLDDTSVIFGAEGSGELSTSYGARMGLMQFFGEMTPEMSEIFPRLTEDSFPGVLANVIAGRISNRLGTGGRNFTVDAACASSLAALDIAISELTSGKAGMVVLGGADLHNSISDFLMFSSTYALSKKGRSATFSEDADGIALGEGVGVIILKRLNDAIRDKNRIYAVIEGIGGSSDGKNLGLTAPSRRGQIRALERAFENAGISPAEVGLIESHGTGTIIGDRTELQALTDVFLEGGTPPGRIALGSVKSQIGHTKCAAGMAGLIKIVNCVRHGLLPPTLHISKPNDVYTKSSPFAFRTEKTGYWLEERRIAGVSGFGFGGTNYHALVRNYEKGRPKTPLKSWPAELFVFPGETKEQAEALMDKVCAMFTVNDKLRLRDVAYSLSLKISPDDSTSGSQAARPSNSQTIHYAIVASTWDELLARIADARSGIENENVRPRQRIDGKVAFLFTGQGSQRINMAADLFIVFPQMRRLLNTQPAYERILFPNAVFSDEENQAQRLKITDTRNAQPLLGLVDLAIARLLADFGILPDMVAGHSYGEVPALCFAGVFQERELVGISRARADAILAAAGDDPGRMSAFFTDNKTLEELLKDEKNVWAVNYNSHRQTAVAGTDAGMASLLKKAEIAGVTFKELQVACAFHSPLLQGADETFAAYLRDIEFKEPASIVMSNTNGAKYPQTTDGIKQRLAEQLVKPVYFADEVEKMYEKGATVFIEAGPGGSTIKLVEEILKGKEIALIQTEQGGAEGLTVFLQGLAKYIASGRSINMDKLFEGREAALLDMDEARLNKASGVVWNVDGRSALPEEGEPPAHAGKPGSDFTSLREKLKWNYSGVSTEQVLLSYLDNMRLMISDQRDVLLGYLEPSASAPREAAPRRSFVRPGAQSTEPTASSAAQEPGATASMPDELPEISALSQEQITAILFETVSEKTGYPVDMLNLDMDLEADLSIDSIKKMEIVGGLRTRIKLPERTEEMDIFFEKMISVKNFKDLTVWIEDIGQAGAAGELAQPELKVFTGGKLVADFSDTAPERSEKWSVSEDERPSMVEPAEIIRMTLFEKPYPLGAHDKDVKCLAGKVFAVTDDGNGLAEKVVTALTALDARARIFAIDSAMEDSSGANAELPYCDGLILINSKNGSIRYSVLDLFRLLKNADMHKLDWTLVFDDFSSCGPEIAEKINSRDLPGGFTGFIKSLNHEYRGKRFSTINFDSPINPETFAGMVTAELAVVKPLPELFYKGGERFLMFPKINKPQTGALSESQAVLEADSVVVVLGGAQGITPHIIKRLAKNYPCHYILLGRSAPESINEGYAELKTVDEIRQCLLEHSGIKQPKEIELRAKQIFKASRIASAVALINGAGGKAEYLSVDVTDDQKFSAALTDIKKKYGRIDGIIHAAGILEDKLFRDKEIASFARVYNTKTAPLMTILDQLLTDLKLFVMFSSMAASFGNAGQCDYAAGNSVFDSLARMLKRRNPALKVTAFDWGPWKGAGMVNSGLEDEFKRKGISFIELDKGAEFFVNELQNEDETTVLALAGYEKDANNLLGI
jgi:acyl transferase domain-containing protein/NAD(P)H-dependent flavin oxidoreductase YrpB (nitropropane dioxygenase family)/NAD(P)-dependent dehydrogenase (short-subunit alcohol dehydrogenase family)